MAKCLHKQMIKKNERSCYMFEIFCPFLWWGHHDW
jgi:hypothetical protein